MYEQISKTREHASQKSHYVVQGRIQRVLLGGANYGERGSASLYGGLGACPQWGPGAKPLVRGSGGRSPPEANEVFAAESAILG